MKRFDLALWTFFCLVLGFIAGVVTVAGQSHRSHAYANGTRITFDEGGYIITYIDKYTDMRDKGEKLVIDGMCISACTLFTGLVPDKNVCVTPYARLAFHSATDQGKFSSESTRLIWHIYPERIRTLLRRYGWDGSTEHPSLIYVEGDELADLYAACGDQ